MVNRRKVLGKGLLDLGLSELLSQQEEKDYMTTQTSIDQLVPGRYQPRRRIDQVTLNELANSIRQQGIIQPIIVRQKDDGYHEIIAGERRWKAAKLAELTHVPVIIRQISDKNAMTLALIENIQREDLNVVEEAFAIKRLTNDYQLTHQQAADILGKSRSNISNTLRLLNLQDEILNLLENGELERGHAIALLSLANQSQQLTIAKQLIAKCASVREAEVLIRRLQQKQDDKQDKQATTQQSFNSAVKKQLEQLTQSLQGKVSVNVNRQGKGKLTIHFSSQTQLGTILDQITHTTLPI